MTSFDVATDIIDEAIEAQQGPLPPTFLVEFLLEPWRAHMARIHGEHGETSTKWADIVKATNLLLWSVAPKLNVEEKQALAASLGDLLPWIREVMDAAGWQQTERSAFLTELGRCHLCLIKTGWDASAGTRDLVGSAKPADAKIDLTDTVHLDASDPRYREYLDALNNVQVEQIEIASPPTIARNRSGTKLKR
jgi:hypothetical protein